MRFKKMRATFGRLSGETLEPGPGLNIIQAPNEAGKSTWAGFIKAMLYGIDTRDRDKRGHLADKNRFQPWSGAPMEGELDLYWQGRNITLRRRKQGNAPFGGLTAVYTGTEEPVPGLTGENCGEMLTGVSREVYERSAFIGQGGMALTAAPELERRIAALVSSGEEDVSYSQTEGRLREWLNRRRVNKTVGLIPKLEEELENSRRSLAHLEQAAAAISRGEEERLVLEREKLELEWDRETHLLQRRRELNQRFAQAREELEAAQEEIARLEQEQNRLGPPPDREKLKRAQGDLQYLKVLEEEIRRCETVHSQALEERDSAASALQVPVFEGKSGEEALKKAGEDAAAAQTAEKSRAFASKLGWGLLILTLPVAAVWLLAHFQLWGLIPLPPWALVLAEAVLVAGSLIFFRKAGQHRRSRRGLLDPYGEAGPEALARDYQKHWQEMQEKEQALKNLQGVLQEHQTRQESGKEELLAFVHTFAPEARDLYGCSAALSRALNLDENLRTLREKEELLRRRRDDLAAQGASEADTLELRHPPRFSPEETQARLAAAEVELARVNQALNMARGEQNALGDPAALCARVEELEGQLERRRVEYQALTTALNGLKAANARLQERFSPELNRLAGKWMARLTEGRYTSVSLSREMEASAAQPGGVLPRRALALSQGTADQLYLAVRLAVSQLCLPGGDTAPLVLDDALASFDDARMERALECLAQLGKERQILLFTCHSREGDALAGREDVTFLSLKG